ncbi:DUF2071 domain-containing protein [Halomicroarcula sp. GCM10025709]|uniref:DUF2071 domain-containing protein n=1 Tax=Halomicroarcula sp. GCM10025709 TaxID=3252669 RepID=UPI0036225801
MFSLTPLSATLGPVSFCHWPVDRASVAGSVPEWAAVETADDTAWVTAVGYTVESVRAFGRSVGGPTEVVTVQVPVRGPTDQRGPTRSRSFASVALSRTRSRCFRSRSNRRPSIGRPWTGGSDGLSPSAADTC